MRAFFEWMSQSALGEAMRESLYGFPIAEMVHLTGLGLLLGAMIFFNGRFFGIGMKRQSAAELASDFAPWVRLALVLMVISGIPMFAMKAEDLWSIYLTTYSTKMGLIAAAVLLYYFVQVPLARRGRMGLGMVAAVVSLVLWFGAALAGLSLEFL
jgi:hypothetical protein